MLQKDRDNDPDDDTLFCGISQWLRVIFRRKSQLEKSNVELRTITTQQERCCYVPRHAYRDALQCVPHQSSGDGSPSKRKTMIDAVCNDIGFNVDMGRHGTSISTSRSGQSALRRATAHNFSRPALSRSTDPHSTQSAHDLEAARQLSEAWLEQHAMPCTSLDSKSDCDSSSRSARYELQSRRLMPSPSSLETHRPRMRVREISTMTTQLDQQLPFTPRLIASEACHRVKYGQHTFEHKNDERTTATGALQRSSHHASYPTDSSLVLGYSDSRRSSPSRQVTCVRSQAKSSPTSTPTLSVNSMGFHMPALGLTETSASSNESISTLSTVPCDLSWQATHRVESEERSDDRTLTRNEPDLVEAKSGMAVTIFEKQKQTIDSVEQVPAFELSNWPLID